MNGKSVAVSVTECDTVLELKEKVIELLGEVWMNARALGLRVRGGSSDDILGRDCDPVSASCLSAGDELEAYQAAASIKAPLTCSLGGHPTQLVLSACNRLLCVVFRGERLRVYSTETGSLVSHFGSHWTTAAFSPCGKWVASGNGLCIDVHHVESGQLHCQLRGHSSWVLPAWSPCGLWVVSASWDGSVRVWSAADGGCEWCAEQVTDGSTLAVATEHVVCSDGTTLVVLDITQGEVQHVLSLDESASDAQVTQDSRFVVACSGTVLSTWCLSTGAKMHEIKTPLKATCISLSAGHVVAVYDRRNVRLWDLSSGDCLKCVEVNGEVPVSEVSWYGVQISACGTVLFVAKPKGVEVIQLA